MGRQISDHVKRKLYAESMGKCMNPNCWEELIKVNGDIMEKAHIIPFCDTLDNSFENLVILCPNCHTDFDKNSTFTPGDIKGWKQIRKQELDRFFCRKYANFDEMRKNVAPLLLENKCIYEQYYCNDKKELWNKFQYKILSNNKELREMLINNFELIQYHPNKDYSNLELVNLFLTHIDEFEISRLEEKKLRQVLFPLEINSMFGVSPVKHFTMPSVELLEELISVLQDKGKFISIGIGNANPYIELNEDRGSVKVYLSDTPRLRQFYFDYKCLAKSEVRLESLNFALKYINSKGVRLQILNCNNLREVLVNNVKMIFIYKYCLSKVELEVLSPEANSVIVNLHNWNDRYCISNEAYDFSKIIGVHLLTMEDFYKYINAIQR